MKMRLFLLFAIFLTLMSCKQTAFPTGESVQVQPKIDPDYQGLVIPFNMAPLNFTIQEAGQAYAVRLSGDKGDAVEIISSSALIQFPLIEWRNLLKQNQGGRIHMDILVQDDAGNWKAYKSLENQISNEAIDPVLVYRFLKPAHNFWNEMGIYQRDLTSFEIRPLIENTSINKACVNCHAFNQNKPLPMMFHARGDVGATLVLVDKNQVQKVNTKTAFNVAPAAYRSWHPSGKLLAFSNNKLVQIFHATGETREVSDLASNLIV